jgi:hypothetical protein
MPSNIRSRDATLIAASIVFAALVIVAGMLYLRAFP